MATSSLSGLAYRSFLPLAIVAVLVLSLFQSCAQDPQEEPIARLEAFLQTLEGDLNSGNQGKNPTLQAQELRNIHDAVLALDPAVLDRKLEDRRDRALGESELYLLVLIDEATKASASPQP